MSERNKGVWENGGARETGKQEMREMRAKGEKLSIVETNGKGE